MMLFMMWWLIGWLYDCMRDFLSRGMWAIFVGNGPTSASSIFRTRQDQLRWPANQYNRPIWNFKNHWLVRHEAVYLLCTYPSSPMLLSPRLSSSRRRLRFLIQTQVFNLVALGITASPTCCCLLTLFSIAPSLLIIHPKHILHTPS